jgi:hypothetical protein
MMIRRALGCSEAGVTGQYFDSKRAAGSMYRTVLLIRGVQLLLTSQPAREASEPYNNVALRASEHKVATVQTDLPPPGLQVAPWCWRTDVCCVLFDGNELVVSC